MINFAFFYRNEAHDGVERLDDLTNLTHLHEAAILSSLNDRFEQDFIYTLTGPILIAINPFKTIPGLYDETVSWLLAEINLVVRF